MFSELVFLELNTYAVVHLREIMVTEVKVSFVRVNALAWCVEKSI